MLTLENFQKSLCDLTNSNHFCIAFSGGVDSAVLLHLFAQLQKIEQGIHLRAIHINHGLSASASSWSETCQRVCLNYAIPLITKEIALKKQPKFSLEETARTERYSLFLKLLQSQEILVTAHHQNDQAETLLLQLFRGAGPKGLASIAPSMPFGKGTLLRPLLSFSRREIEAYANKEQLLWVEDESNQNIRFDRNYLRQELLPLIQSRWPAITRNLARVAQHCAEADRYINEQTADIFKQVYDVSTQSLAVPLLLTYPASIQHHIIRYWLQYLKLPLPSTQKLHSVQKNVLFSRHDATPLLCWKNVEVRRYDARLYAMKPLPPHDAKIIYKWDLTDDLRLPNDLGIVKLSDVQRLGLNKEQLQEVTIRFRQGGERCRLKNRNHSQSLKKLMQDWRVPPWQRDRIPLLYNNNILKAVIGYAVCEG